METQTRALRNAKVGTNKHDSFAPTYRELKKEFNSTTMWSTSFGYVLTTSRFKGCVSGNKKKYVLE